MRMKLAAAIVALWAGCTAAADLSEGMKKGSPELKSVSALAFGPDGILFIGDSTAGVIHAIATRDTKATGMEAIQIDQLDTKVADMLGAKSSDLAVNDVKVNPVSGTIFVAATRKGMGGGSVIFKVGADKKLTEFALKDITYSSLELTNAPKTENLKSSTITGMAFVGGKLVVAGLSNEEFTSTFRSISFPFQKADRGTGVEIWHAAHGKHETNSPIRTFTPYQVAGVDYLIASYTCTPLVRVPVADLKDGAKIKGTTVAELGNRNRPLDIIIYTKDGKDFALMANSSRGVMKIPLSGIDKAEAITKSVGGGGTAGVAFETVADLKGVVQLDRLDNKRAVIVLDEKEKGLTLKTIDLP
jgi:hypothetical protein